MNIYSCYFLLTSYKVAIIIIIITLIVDSERRGDWRKVTQQVHGRTGIGTQRTGCRTCALTPRAER